MAFIIGPAVTLMTQTSTDKYYKIQVILQVFCFFQVAVSLASVTKIFIFSFRFYLASRFEGLCLNTLLTELYTVGARNSLSVQKNSKHG